MILVIGGLGFVGSNTTEALLELGEDCIVTQHENDIVPSFIKDFVGKQVFVEQVDVMDLDSLMTIGKKYPITGIVNLVTGGMPAAPDADALGLVKDVQATITAIANIVKAAEEWGTKRITLASAPVVYNGITDQPWKEDEPLPMSATNPMELAKKYSELLSGYLGNRTGIECIQMRLAAMYGPAYDPTRSSLVGRLVHAAVKGEKPSLEGMRFMSVNADDGGDQCYVKDAARGIALLQTTEKLKHTVYNISDGRVTTNQQIVDAVKKAIPEFDVELPTGHAANSPMTSWQYDISRINQDTDYQPKFDIEAGIADYIAWLRQGNER